MVEARFSPHHPRALAARRAISDLAALDPSSRELLDEVEFRLRSVVPFDTGGWWTSDPETRLPTELWNFDLDAVDRDLTEQGSVLLEAVDTDDEVNADDHAHDWSASARTSREGAELRVLARSGENVWGSAFMAREDPATPFSHEEIDYIVGISKDVGLALRADLLRIVLASKSDPDRPDTSSTPATILLGDDDIVEGHTSVAQMWLGKLGVDDLTTPLPTALRWISLQARAEARYRGSSRRLRAARARIATTDRELVVVQAQVLEGSGTRKVVMSLEPASSSSLFPLLLALYDLSAREKTVAALVVGGWPVEDVGAHLGLSTYTIRDHIKSIYAKVGVRSRPELTARLGGSTATATATAVV